MRIIHIAAAVAVTVLSTEAKASELGDTWRSEPHRENLKTAIDEVSTQRFLHGFRLGYLYMMNSDKPVDATKPNGLSLEERYGMRSAHQFIMGYELAWRMVGHDWLNVLLVGNMLVSGLEQSRFYPSWNGLVGFEFNETAQLGVGVSVTPTKDKPAHMIIAGGWTPRVGDIHTPLHLFFVPDVDGHNRLGVTVGVNW